MKSVPAQIAQAASHRSTSGPHESVPAETDPGKRQKNNEIIKHETCLLYRDGLATSLLRQP